MDLDSLRELEAVGRNGMLMRPVVQAPDLRVVLPNMGPAVSAPGKWKSKTLQIKAKLSGHKIEGKPYLAVLVTNSKARPVGADLVRTENSRSVRPLKLPYKAFACILPYKSFL